MPRRITFRLLALGLLFVPLTIACSSEDGGGGGGGAAAGTGGTGQGATGGSGATSSGGTGQGATGGGGGSVGAGEPPGLEGITQLHNDARATEGVAPLTWDSGARCHRPGVGGLLHGQRSADRSHRPQQGSQRQLPRLRG